MSISSSIFQKPCPACAAIVSVSAARCDCGHDFESSAHPLSTLETTLRDEELYESYLAARAEQARQAARTADEALANDGTNPELASAASLAREVAISIAGDLAEQQKKLAGIRNTMHETGQTTTTDLLAISYVKEKPAPPRPAIAPGAPMMRPVSAADVTPKAPTWSATATQKAAAVLATLKSAKARETDARARQHAATAKEKKQKVANNPSPFQPQPAAASTASTVAPPAFRKEQAARAEKITQALRPADSKDCPNCTSSVPLGTTRCRCGFAFDTSGRDLPSLTLCTGDFTALRDSLKLNLR